MSVYPTRIIVHGCVAGSGCSPKKHHCMFFVCKRRKPFTTFRCGRGAKIVEEEGFPELKLNKARCRTMKPKQRLEINALQKDHKSLEV